MERNMRPVDVISLCSADGEIRPLRLRIQEPDQTLTRVDIDEIITVSEIEFVGMEAKVFLCRATVREARRFFELKYALRTHTWYLLRTIC